MSTEKETSAEVPAGNLSESPLPAVSLPKGGGAIRGIGEKFAANPVTGTGSMTVPIATSPGRSGFGPQLSVSYDSGAGNGIFGFGWSLSLPSITRKTDKGLPQYFDAQDSDVFILSGAEDLVPVYRQDAAGAWVRDALGSLVIHEDEIDGYRVRRYRPRVEGLFAQVERWTLAADPHDVHWRSISKDNILTLYGSDANSRIVDPEDHSRVFSWLICETRDDKGNAVVYRYKEEDGTGVDLTNTNERNRGPREDTRRAANRYLKHIYYGNRTPLLDQAGHRPRFLVKDIDGQIPNASWMFEAVLDYGEHDRDTPMPKDAGAWPYRSDPFSSYRSGFEVRTTRLCRRVLMFHHFDGEAGVANDCLVRSTDFKYSDEQDRIYTFLQAVTQTGYRRNSGGYDKRSLPPVEYEYTRPIVQGTVEEVDAKNLENLPIGVDGSSYQWIDLHGEGIPGILTEQAGVWFYKRNLSPISEQLVEFAPRELVATKPNLGLAGGQAQFMDLAGDGQPDLVMLDGPMAGLYEHDDEESWQPFRPFTSRLNRDTRDPNLKFIDLDGDGHADVLVSEDDAFVWHPSVGEEGFGPARTVHKTLDEEKGPRLVFADGTQSIYLADLSGDGLTDLVRIRNGEICYWPNLGYGRFGSKVIMDHAPYFDNPEQFDHKRIRMADIDGSGTTDIIYLHGDGVRLYFNQSGNSWSGSRDLNLFPHVDDVVSIVATDLLGNGTACLVWSSPLPGDARRPMRYVNLMGAQKPHLLFRTANNLGAETVVTYTPSTKFYLQDKRDGKSWITRLPFPVHVVERVETFDHISRNRFVTRYAYHHGYFDGEEREFRGFGMVEQWDTEELNVLAGRGTQPTVTNVDSASHVPPAHTKTWFHTGAYLGREHISDFFAGLLDSMDEGEYYREPGLTDSQALALLLPDTVLPSGLMLEEEREACRALKGMMLRQEVYALDDTNKAFHPYTVAEQNFSVRIEQPRGENRHAVFFTHPREAITYHYERNPADPRIQHGLTLEVNNFGNVLKSLAIGYGRRSGMSILSDADKAKQEQLLITYTENDYTVNDSSSAADWVDAYRAPLLCETRTYELTGFAPAAGEKRLAFEDFANNSFAPLTSLNSAPYNSPFAAGTKGKRLIEHVRTIFRLNDLTAPLPLGQLQSRALPFESYKLAFTTELVQTNYLDSGKLSLSDATTILSSVGGYVHSEGDANWWIPSGRVFYSDNPNHSAAEELAETEKHFFLPRRYRDPFHTSAVSTESVIDYDAHDLLLVRTRDAVGNVVTAATQDDNLSTTICLDYRVLQPFWVTDANGNRTRVAFDILGQVSGTAVMGKPGENLGDLLDGLATDPTQIEIDDLHDSVDPHLNATVLLHDATTRIIYDVDRFQRTRTAHPEDPAQWQPSYSAIVARETHLNDPLPPQGLKIQISFSFSDGFGREIQKKIQAEPEKINGVPGPPRWVGSGWTIFNNKGKPVRQYEPFFSATHRFEFAVQVGVSSILFYDPVERVVATLHPNHSYEKFVFDPWQVTTYDVNDTILNAAGISDPTQDSDVSEFFSRLPDADYLPSWHEQRLALPTSDPERQAAEQAAVHSQTPTVAHLDALGRTFLTVAHNRFRRNNAIVEERYASRVELDIEGNQRAVRDAIEHAGDAQGRIVMRYDYDMLGNRIHQSSMEAGERWTLNDVTGKQIYAWDSRGHTFRAEYDPLRRPLRSFVKGADPANSNQELMAERFVYGEQHPQAEIRNLRSKIYLHFDQAGLVIAGLNDFKGNPRQASRRLTNGTQYRQSIDWRDVDNDHVALPANATDLIDLVALETALTARLDAEAYRSRTTYDALNRAIQVIAPRSNQLEASRNIIQPVYNEANLLERVDVWLDHSTEPDKLIDATLESPSRAGVNNIDYDPKGQRLRIDYKNGASTFYDYDPLTFRLRNLKTTRSTRLNGPSQIFADSAVQDLHYTYDPVGNITRIEDAAQKTIFHNNEQVDPVCEYFYDATYRLIEARGREHIGQTAFDFTPANRNQRDQPFAGLADFTAHPNDIQTLRNYTELYEYDGVGNFRSLRHLANGGSWTRTYDYEEASLIEGTKQSNRLTRTTVGNGVNQIERYVHDAHGNMTRMPHLGGDHPDPNMFWDYRDQLSEVDLGGGGTAYYDYDGAGQRVRKVIETQNGTLKEERIYLGGFEVFRNYNAGGDVTLARETLQIMDDKQRIALVETRTLDAAGTDPAPTQLIRYQLGNHLGSSSLELDEQAQVISYEEYTPYGSTSYQTRRTQNETPKRNRYTGKERDEESGLYYHGARYYAPWLGRWLSADPEGSIDGFNLFQFVRSNPVRLYDSGGREAVDVLTNSAQFVIDNNVDVASIPTRLVADRIEDKFNAFDAATRGELVEALGWYTGVNRVVESLAKTYTEYTDAGASTGEAVALISGDITGFNDLAEAKTGHDKYAVELSGADVAIKASSGITKLAGTVATLAGGVLARSSITPQPATVNATRWTTGASPTETTIKAIVETPGRVRVAVSGPLKNLKEKVTKAYEGGQLEEWQFDAKSSVPGATDTVKTTIKIHDPDPTAPLGSNSRSGPTVNVGQAKGKRMFVPDTSTPGGGRWVNKSTATPIEMNEAHIPICKK